MVVLLSCAILWLMWTGATTREEVWRLQHRRLPEGVNTVVMDKGEAIPWYFGTVAQNPVGYFGCMALLLALSYYLWTPISARRSGEKVRIEEFACLVGPVVAIVILLFFVSCGLALIYLCFSASMVYRALGESSG